MKKSFPKLVIVGLFASLIVSGLLIPWKGNEGNAFAAAQIRQVPLPGKNIPKYVDPLPTFVGKRVTGTALTVSMEEFQQFVMPQAMYALDPLNPPAPGVDPLKGTYVWGYKVYGSGPLYPAFTIEAQKGIANTVIYINNLVNPVLQQYLTVDQTLHWADPWMQHGLMTPYAGPVPAAVHLHGGEVPSESDGHPDAWFTPGLGITGPAWNLGADNICYYPNTQEAATLWFHDHALGITRLNVYAGLAGFYLLRDPLSLDTGIPALGGLPAGNYEIEVAIQDRMFDTNGQWYFPDLGINPTVHPFWIPEFVGDAIVVNGKTWPYLEVEPRRYRFRLLNGSNARFYNLSFENKLPFWQIGTDGGLLDTPVRVNQLLLAPGERADVIVDFTGLAPGNRFLMTNDARAPFPKGAPADPQTVGQIMQFRVISLTGTDTSFNPATAAAGSLRPGNLIEKLPGVAPIVTKRQLTLNEVMGAGGPLEILLNNTKWDGMMSPNAGGITEEPLAGSTEMWEIINLTADTHPIHLHLVQFQILNRQPFQTNKYIKAYNALFPGGLNPADGLTYAPGVYMPGYGPPQAYTTINLDGAVGGNPAVTPYLQQNPVLPDPNERGWKDTIRVNPGEVTRIIVRFAPQDFVKNPRPSPFFSFDPTLGPGYVWHCHIIDHEDNEMMRPYKLRK